MVIPHIERGRILVLILTLLVMLSSRSWLQEATAAAPILDLPAQHLAVHYGGWLAGQHSTIDITLSDVGAGFDIQDGTYPGWCIQDFVLTAAASATVYSSVGNLPADAASLPWNKINYVLNHKSSTKEDVQIAIWMLVGDPLPTSLGEVTPAAQAMLDAASVNPNYVPAPGDVVAVIVYSDGITNKDPNSFQEVIIEVIVPAGAQPGIDIRKQAEGPDTRAFTLQYDFVDPLTGPPLDPNRWAYGTWNGGSYTPVFDNGLVLSGSNGAWVRSVEAFTGPRILEGTVAFGAGPWQHFGFGSDGFSGNQYLLFTTKETSDRLFARSSNGVETSTDLGPLSAFSGPHDYYIVWQPKGDGSDDVSYYIDGALKAQHSVASEPALYVYLSHNSGDTHPLRVTQVSIAQAVNVPFEIEVRNTGTADLSDVKVTDAQAPGCAKEIGNLKAGASIRYSCTAYLVTQGFTNEACVTGMASGTTVTDCDPSTVEISRPPAALGDRVWNDPNTNGIQDAGESGIPNVPVQLFACGSTTALATKTTDAGGLYQFTNLAPGSYFVQFMAPKDFVFSPAGQGADPALDSNANPATGETACITLAPGEINHTIAAGLYKPAALGDRVWADLNANGIQDEGEPGISDVTVQLYACAGALIKETTSNGNGLYHFTGLTPGSYAVRFLPLDGYVFSPAGSGDGTNDSRPDAAGVAPCVALGPGQTDNNQDAGLYQPVALGDRVWYDRNQNGIQDPNEPGYNGVTVALYNNATCSGASIASTTTAVGPAGFGNGYYQFINLLVGRYCVQFGSIPAGWSISPANQGNGTNDSKANTNAQIPNINLTMNDQNEDMGIYVPGSLGDNVQCVSTGQGLANITVNLFKDFGCNGSSDGPVFETTQTDTSGFYEFTGLEVALAGDMLNQTCYIVRVDTTDPNLGTCNVPIPPTEYRPRLDTNNPKNPNNDFEFEEKPASVCDLAVTKTCQVATPVSTNFVCNDAKPIDAISMIWQGSQPIKIKAWKGSVGSTLLATMDNIQNGQEVSVSGYAGSPNDVYWEIFTAGTDNGLGQSTFHLSCSDDNMNGPEDCGKPEGDGKDRTGFLNDWLFDGMAGNGLVLDCSPTPPEPTNSCEVTLGPNPSCQTLGKPTSLTFKYTGGGCSAGNNLQGSKATCVGTIAPNLPVTVLAHSKDGKTNYAVSPTAVDPGAEFTVSTSSFASDSIIELIQPGGTEVDGIHTSCSQPLAVGDIFGSLKLVGFNDQRAGSRVTYNYKVTNNGSFLKGVTLLDIPLGSIAGPFDLNSGNTRTFQKVVEVNQSTTNVGTFSGTLEDGKTCSASASATVTVVEPCAVCKGGTTLLTLKYLGTAVAPVVVYDYGSAKADRILFQGTLQPGQEIAITPRPGQSKLNNDVSIYINGVLNVKIKTDCSQSIGPGLRVGAFEIVKGRSKDSGVMCPLNTCDARAAQTLEFSGNEVRWSITNGGDLGLEVSRISMTWPTANGYLDEIKRDGDVIHKGNFNPPSAVIGSGWEGDLDKRTIKPGDTSTLKLKFQNSASTVGGYPITVEFTYGCSVSIN